MFRVRFDSKSQDILGGLTGQIPKATEYALEQALGTMKVAVQKATPEGIRYRKIGRKKTGEPVKGARGESRWVSSGVLKRSWEGSRKGQQLILGTTVSYAPILETGAYPGIGKLRMGNMPGGQGQVSPRTTAESGKIWSSRAVGGILKPLIKKKDFLNGVVSTIVREMGKRLKRTA